VEDVGEREEASVLVRVKHVIADERLVKELHSVA